MFRHRKVVFLATIEYDYKSLKESGRLRDNRDMPYERLEEKARKAITEELPKDLKDIYGLSIKTSIERTQEGSLLIFFSAVVAGIGFLSSYADFFASIQLIKQHARWLLNRVTREVNGQAIWQFDVNVEEQFPYVNDPASLGTMRSGKLIRKNMEEVWSNSLTSRHSSNRDAFFWFLLILNILLLTAIGFLVAKAVEKTYFM